jgi:predicted RNA binding protein YcfA (HicA-like mRNA interferase family)
VKKKDLEKKIKAFGWYFLRQGANHEIWTNGEINEAIPRHKEIDEYLARKIINKAKLSRKEAD